MPPSAAELLANQCERALRQSEERLTHHCERHATQEREKVASHIRAIRSLLEELFVGHEAFLRSAKMTDSQNPDVDARNGDMESAEGLIHKHFPYEGDIETERSVLALLDLYAKHRMRLRSVLSYARSKFQEQKVAEGNGKRPQREPRPHDTPTTPLNAQDPNTDFTLGPVVKPATPRRRQ